MRTFVTVLAAVVVLGCETGPGSAGGGSAGGGASGGGSAGGSGGGGSAGGGAMLGPDAGPLPCDIAEMVGAKCGRCHGTPLQGYAPYAFRTRLDLIRPVDASGTTRAQRGLDRVRNDAAPMPPLGYVGFTPQELARFAAWVDAGAPQGTNTACHFVDAGVAPTTCETSTFWAGGNDASEEMNPGLACRQCHIDMRPSVAFEFSGTVYREAHAKDTCNAGLDAGVTIQIIDKNGQVALSMTPYDLSGNFRSDGVTSGVALPYTVRLNANGKTARMLTPQMSGDCNSCHTEQGTSGAVGRITHPR